VDQARARPRSSRAEDNVFLFLEVKTWAWDQSDKSLCIESFIANSSRYTGKEKNPRRKKSSREMEMETGDETWPSHKNNLRKRSMYVKSYAAKPDRRSEIRWICAGRLIAVRCNARGHQDQNCSTHVEEAVTAARGVLGIRC